MLRSHRTTALPLCALLLLPTLAAAQTKEAKVTRRDSAPLRRVTAPTRKMAPELRPLAVAAEKTFRELGVALTEGNAEKATALMDEDDILFQLDPPRSGTSAEDEEPLRSHQQVFYLWKAFLAQHSVEKTECQCPQEFEDPDNAHGVLEVELDNSSVRRFYISLRRAERDWRVAELRALP